VGKIERWMEEEEVLVVEGDSENSGWSMRD
jgi:hypothetical protein